MKQVMMKMTCMLAALSVGMPVSGFAQHSGQCQAQQEQLFEGSDKAALEQKVKAFVDQKEAEGYLIDDVQGWEKRETVVDKEAHTKTVTTKQGKKVFKPSWKGFKFQLFSLGNRKAKKGKKGKYKTLECANFSKGPKKGPVYKFNPQIKFGKIRMTGVKYEKVKSEVQVDATYKELVHYFARVLYHKHVEEVREELEVRSRESVTPPAKKTSSTTSQSRPGGTTSSSASATKKPATGTRPAGTTSQGTRSQTFEVKRGGQWVTISEAEYKQLVKDGAKVTQ